MPFYIVYSKANCTKNSLQACKALLFGGLGESKILSHKDQSLRGKSPGKNGGNMGTWAELPARSRKRPVQIQTYPAGASTFFFSARAIQYFGIILFRCVNQSFQAKGFLSHSSRMNSALSASNGIIRGPVASSSII